MGQYFKLVNHDKKEVINPWDIGGGAKFFEWLYNPPARVLVWLLRESDGDGGGDIHTGERARYTTLGRWASDRITLIGDDDSGGLYDRAGRCDGGCADHQRDEFTDVSATLRKEFNEGVERDGFGDEYRL